MASAGLAMALHLQMGRGHQLRSLVLQPWLHYRTTPSSRQRFWAQYLFRNYGPPQLGLRRLRLTHPLVSPRPRYTSPHDLSGEGADEYVLKLSW